MTHYPPGVNPEIKRRIDVAVAAYAYEFETDPLMSDAEFDALCAAVDPSVDTGRPELDEFFRAEFEPFTGVWVHDHPDIAGLRRIYLLKRRRGGRRVFRCEAPATFWTTGDLFAPAREPVKHPCDRCGKDVTKNPLDGGCHC